MTARLTRLLAAALLLAGGIVHLNLWNGGYRYIPRIGPLFLANFVGSIALAGAVLVSRRAGVSLAGMAFAGGSVVALILSRTVGLFGFTEMIWTPDAIKTLASELGAITTLGFALLLQSGHPARLQPRTTR
jgi:O-antigen/teichoic acid export membrane protein